MNIRWLSCCIKYTVCVEYSCGLQHHHPPVKFYTILRCDIGVPTPGDKRVQSLPIPNTGLPRSERLDAVIILGDVIPGVGGTFPFEWKWKTTRLIPGHASQESHMTCDIVELQVSDEADETKQHLYPHWFKTGRKRCIAYMK